MPGFDQSPPPTQEPEAPSELRTRFGHLLFLAYLILYTAYVLLSAFAPQVMERTPLAGVNLGVIYGLGLIFAAFALAVVYDLFGRWLERRGDPPAAGPQGKEAPR